MVVRFNKIAQAGAFLAVCGLCFAAQEQGLLPLAPPHSTTWHTDSRPLYHSPAPRGGPSYPDEVDESTGVLEHETGPDLAAPNRYGGQVLFNRIYTTAQALNGKHERGMARGWTTEWSVTGSSSDPSSWAKFQFKDPKGAVEEWTAVLKDDVPTGEFNLIPGTGFILTGVPAKTPGAWESITWQMNGLSKLVFRPQEGEPNRYRLSEIFESNGKQTSFHYDAANGNRLKEVDDADGKPLMWFEYGDDGLLTTAVDCTGISVSYGYKTQAGCTCLTTVSSRGTAAEPGQTLWQYGYDAILGAPFLATVETPGPHGFSLHRNTYDPESGRETMFTDADGNRTVFDYKPGKTQVSVYGPAGG